MAGVPEPATPYLAVDVERMQRNIDRVSAAATAVGVALRPHAKTHKTLEVARLQMAAGAVGLTVATIGEAEVYVEHGFDDVFIAYPLWVDAEHAVRLASLREQAVVTVGVDSAESAANLGRRLPGLAVMVEVDSGQHRTGAWPEEAGRVAEAAVRAGLDVRGVFTFPGHGYSPDGRVTAAEDEATALTRAEDAVRQAGIEVRVLSGGATPTLEASLRPGRGVTELRPGVYVFNDAQQWELGSASPADIALTCHATVVSHSGGSVVVYAGVKALGADRASYSSGAARLLDHPQGKVVQLSEHHGVVEGLPVPLPPLGSRLRLVPNHVCAAVNLADALWAGQGDEMAPWAVIARGRNS